MPDDISQLEADPQWQQFSPVQRRQIVARWASSLPDFGNLDAQSQQQAVNRLQARYPDAPAPVSPHVNSAAALKSLYGGGSLPPLAPRTADEIVSGMFGTAPPAFKESPFDRMQRKAGMRSPNAPPEAMQSGRLVHVDNEGGSSTARPALPTYHPKKLPANMTAQEFQAATGPQSFTEWLNSPFGMGRDIQHALTPQGSGVGPSVLRAAQGLATPKNLAIGAVAAVAPEAVQAGIGVEFGRQMGMQATADILSKHYAEGTINAFMASLPIAHMALGKLPAPEARQVEQRLGMDDGWLGSPERQKALAADLQRYSARSAAATDTGVPTLARKGSASTQKAIAAPKPNAFAVDAQGNAAPSFIHDRPEWLANPNPAPRAAGTPRLAPAQPKIAPEVQNIVQQSKPAAPGTVPREEVQLPFQDSKSAQTVADQLNTSNPAYQATVVPKGKNGFRVSVQSGVKPLEKPAAAPSADPDAPLNQALQDYQNRPSVEQPAAAPTPKPTAALVPTPGADFVHKTITDLGKPATADQIAGALGVAPHQIAGPLLELEMSGKVKRGPGGLLSVEGESPVAPAAKVKAAAKPAEATGDIFADDFGTGDAPDQGNFVGRIATPLREQAAQAIHDPQTMVDYLNHEQKVASDTVDKVHDLWEAAHNVKPIRGVQIRERTFSDGTPVTYTKARKLLRDALGGDEDAEHVWDAYRAAAGMEWEKSYKSLHDHLNGMGPGEPPVGGPPPTNPTNPTPAQLSDNSPTPSPAPAPTPASSAPGVEQIDPLKVKVERGLQYKQSEITDTENQVSSSLKGTSTYNIPQGGTWTVWRKRNGDLVAVNSHHRRDLARRATSFVEPTPDGGYREAKRSVPARVLDEAAGWTKEAARAYGVLENIRDGKGNALDAVMALHDMKVGPESFSSHQISLTGNMARDVKGLYGLHADALGRVQSGDVPEAVGSGIGSVRGLEPKSQHGAMDEAARSGITSYGEARRLAEHYLEDQQNGSLKEEQQSGDLFGGEFVAPTSTRGTRVKIEKAVASNLATEHRSLLNGAKVELRDGEYVDKEGRKVEAAKYGGKPAEVAERIRLVFDRNEHVKGEVKRLAGDVANGKLSVTDAAQELTKTVRHFAHQSASELVGGRGLPPDSGLGDAVAGAGPEGEAGFVFEQKRGYSANADGHGEGGRPPHGNTWQEYRAQQAGLALQKALIDDGVDPQHAHRFAESWASMNGPTVVATNAVERAGARHIASELRREALGRDPEKPPVTYAQMAKDRLQSKIDEQSARLKEDLSRGPNSTPADILARAAYLGALHLAKGAVTFADFSARMVKEFGDAIKPHLQSVWDAAHDLKKNPKAFRDAEAKFKPAQQTVTRPAPGKNQPGTAGPGSVLQKVAIAGREVFISVPRAFKFVGDVSAWGRQGAMHSVNNPKAVPGAMLDSLKAVVSEKTYRELAENIKNSPYYTQARDTGAYFSTHADLAAHENLAGREEWAQSRWAEKIPVLGSIVRGSERNFNLYLDTMQMAAYELKAKALEARGKTMDTHRASFEAIAADLNTQRGRQHLGPLEDAAPMLNHIFNSVRFQASRANLINPYRYIKLAQTDPQVAAMALKDVAKAAAVGAAIVGIAKAMGADVEMDARSSDFGQIRIGKTRIDPWAGVRPWVVAAVRAKTGKLKTADGSVIKLDGPSATSNFVRDRLSPGAGMAWDIEKMRKASAEGKTAKNTRGQDLTPKNATEDYLTPAIVGDFMDAIQEQGWAKGIAVASPALVGVGVTTHTGTPRRGMSHGR